MVNFKKRLASGSPEKKIHPVEIYNSLDRTSETGPLRPIQVDILNQWFNSYQTNKDVVLKLHTGQGKTLIGLLIQQSIINQGKGPCIYVCPNIYLMNQTAEQAKKFGIPYVLFGDTQDIPIDFLNGSRILICYAQKIFHGYSKLNDERNKIHIGNIILDDSHACIETIRESFTIKIPKEVQAYSELVELFEEDLNNQGAGTFLEIKEEDYNSFLPVPYWAFDKKNGQVLEILNRNKAEDCIKYKWPLLKDILFQCQCIISGTDLEIAPYLNPIDEFKAFHSATQRILMSATTMDDSFFIKGLGLSKKAIQNPLISKDEKWSGEKMILMPSLMHDSLSRTYIIDKLARNQPGRKKGVVILVPSFKHALPYGKQGCTIASASTIYQEINKLKSGDANKCLVIANRYDGIDLPDDSCRILIIDSKPYSETLFDRNEEICRENSDIINVKIAQKIEQGLGRSVRGEKDYSVIILIGSDLVNFIKNPKTQIYFSPQTRKQIKLGFEIAKMAVEDHDFNTMDSINVITDLIRTCITKREEFWKQFYEENMNQEDEKVYSVTISDILEQEKKAEEAFNKGEVPKAVGIIQGILNSFTLNDSEIGWYLQMIARYQFRSTLSESIKLQIEAFKKNSKLLKPNEGYSYQKLEYINLERTQKIKAWISKFPNHEKLNEKVEEIYSMLSFEETSEHFEEGVYELGKSLGFESQRPDKEMREGPDNLWCIEKNDYLVIECKNRISEKREELQKDETGQLNNSCGWFQNNYPGATFHPIIIVHTKNVSKSTAFNFPTKIIRKSKLKSLKNAFKSFYNEFSYFDLPNITDEKIQELINIHKIDNFSIKTLYSENPYQR